MSKGRGQSQKSKATDDEWNAIWEALQNEGGQQWVAGHRVEEAGETMRIYLASVLGVGQSLKESKTMNGGKCSFSVNVTADGSPLCKPEY
jgi:hypothetical protein